MSDIPAFRTNASTIPSLPLKSVKVLKQFCQENIDNVYQYLYVKLREGVVKNQSEIQLFRLGDTQWVVTLSPLHYGVWLNRLMARAVELENYEQAQRCKNLLEQHSTNMGVG